MNIDMLRSENDENFAFVWPPRSTHVATSCNNVARCCVEMLRAFGQAFRVSSIVQWWVRLNRVGGWVGGGSWGVFV